MRVGLGLVLFAAGLSLLARLYSVPAPMDEVVEANTLGVVLLLIGVIALVRSLLPNRQQRRASPVPSRERGPA